MIVECGHCGAPLDVREGAAILTCRYCGKANERQRMRTISAQTPHNFRPPRQWIPPPQFPAPSNIPLDYHASRIPLVIAVVVLMMAAGIGVGVLGVNQTRRIPGTSLVPGVSAGVPPSVLATLNLHQSREALAKVLQGRITARSVYAQIADPRFESVTFTWDEKSNDHPTNFYLAARNGVPADPRMEEAIASRLHGGLENGGWNWFGGSNLNIQKNTMSVGGNVQITQRGMDEQGDTAHWKEKLDALWKVTIGAAFGFPVTLSKQNAYELLGAGHPFSNLATINAATTVETAPDAMKRLFPGAEASSFINVDVHVAIEHPLFKTADMAWKNKKGGALESVHFRPNLTWPSRREAFVQCLEPKIGRPIVRETDYVNKKKDYEFRSGQVRLLVPEGMAYIVSFGSGILGPDWVKIIGAVNDCH